MELMLKYQSLMLMVMLLVNQAGRKMQVSVEELKKQGLI